MPGSNIPIEWTHLFTIHIYFLPLQANTKFNPIACMRTFFTELIKHDPSITVTALDKKTHLKLATDPLLMNKTNFKRFFQISTNTHATTKKSQVLIGCSLLCDRMIQDIKFDKKQPKFMDWLIEEKIFIEANTLGINKMTTIRYLTKLHTYYTNRMQLKHLLQTTLEDITLNADLAVKLDPSLKDKQTESMSNSDMFAPEIPPFKVYKTKITHRYDKDKVSTNVIGIKCTTAQAHLLQEFFSQLASPASYKKQIRLFIPT